MATRTPPPGLRLPWAMTIFDVVQLIALGWWVIVLLLPGTTFSVSPSFGGMRQIAPEEAWSLVSLALLTLFVASFPRGRGVTLIARGALTAWWWTIAGSMLAGTLGGPLTTGSGVYFALGVGGALTVAREWVSRD